VPGEAAYPTREHQLAAERTLAFFSQLPETQAVILVGSCARGKASPDSCLDIVVLVRPEVLSTERPALEQRWEEYSRSEPAFEAVKGVGKYSAAEIEFGDGCFRPQPREYTSEPDGFELEIGNYLVYGRPLWQQGDYLDSLKRHWLPYYDEGLRRKRLTEARFYGLNNLGHVEPYIGRGLYFQAFRRLHFAQMEFLQALFIARRAYPIAYDKWIREQVVDILGLPEVYLELVSLFEISRFESDELIEKARALERVYGEYLPL